MEEKNIHKIPLVDLKKDLGQSKKLQKFRNSKKKSVQENIGYL